MARTVSAIQNQINAQVATLLPGLTSTSKVAYWNLFTFIVASAIAIFEQLLDAYVASIEAIVNSNISGTALWIQTQLYKFQYGDVVQFINFAPQYPTINITKQIITQASVTTDSNRVVNIKVATGTSPALSALTSPQLTAVIAYLNQIMFAGVRYSLVSLNADQLYVKGTIYYDGQYSQVIQTNVIAAINNYISALPFNSQFNYMKLLDAIQAVQGVKDIKLDVVSAHSDLGSFSASTTIYGLAGGVNILSYFTASGYMIGETSSGNTFADTLTFTPQ